LAVYRNSVIKLFSNTRRIFKTLTRAFYVLTYLLVYVYRKVDWRDESYSQQTDPHLPGANFYFSYHNSRNQMANYRNAKKRENNTVAMLHACIRTTSDPILADVQCQSVKK